MANRAVNKRASITPRTAEVFEKIASHRRRAGAVTVVWCMVVVSLWTFAMYQHLYAIPHRFAALEKEFRHGP